MHVGVVFCVVIYSILTSDVKPHMLLHEDFFPFVGSAGVDVSVNISGVEQGQTEVSSSQRVHACALSVKQVLFVIQWSVVRIQMDFTNLEVIAGPFHSNIFLQLNCGFTRQLN